MSNSSMNSVRNSVRAAALAALAVCAAAAPAAAQTTQTAFRCPEGMGYRFAYAEPDFGAAGADGWDASIKRGTGASAAGSPRLSVRRGAMRCRYPLPHGAFILLVRAVPAGAECEVRQDGYFEPEYFACAAPGGE